MIDREIVATRLSKLREALRRLQPIAGKRLEDYLGSETDRALSEHYLRIALEAMLDCGNHVVAARGYRRPFQLRDIPAILGEVGEISGELANRLARATGLRNRLVHGYTEIDHRLLHKVLQRDLADLEAFAIARSVDAGG
jgi:uncharacterized protein YutE (UPF0331/DUF86 family)